MKQVKKVCAFAMSFMMFTMQSCPVSFAQAASEVDSLIKVLVNKGIISQGDAIQILEEAKSTAQMQQVKAIKEGPSWLANTTFKGDLRIRHQYEDKERSSSNPKHRFRTRFRYGFTNEINDTLTIGARLATGNNIEDGSSADGRSTNQTWGEGFGQLEIGLNEAFFDYHPYDWISVIGGKKEVGDLLYLTDDLLWDSDLTFDGGTIKLNKEVATGVKLFLNGGAYILDQENMGAKDNNNPWIHTIQPGIEYKLKMDGSQMKAKTAFAYYGARNVDDQAKVTTKNAQVTNTEIGSSDKYKYGYDIFSPNAEMGYYWGGEKSDTYVAKMFGSYVYNPDPGDTGFLLGAKAGYDKTGKKFGDWQLAYNYRYLEDDACMDIFPDSDAYGGATNAKGHEISLTLGLCKNVTLGFDYYRMVKISGGELDENLFQTDVVFKF